MPNFDRSTDYDELLWHIRFLFRWIIKCAKYSGEIATANVGHAEIIKFDFTSAHKKGAHTLRTHRFDINEEMKLIEIYVHL